MLWLSWVSDSGSFCSSTQESWDYRGTSQYPSPCGFWHFLKSFTVSLYVPQVGLKLKTFLHPLQPFNLAFCVCGGGHLLTTHSRLLVWCWLGHLLFIQYEHTEEIQQSESRHTAVTCGAAIFSSVARTGSVGSPGPLRHSSFVQALYKEGLLQVLAGLGHCSSSL